MSELPGLFASDPGAVQYARVAVPVPAEGTFAYRVPPAAAPLALPGMRVRVVFSGRPVTATIVATGEQPPADVDPGRIRELGDCLDPLPLLSPVLLALTGWVADHYLASWGEAIRTALPSGIERIGHRRVALTAAGVERARGEGRGSGARSRVLAELLDAGGRGVRLASLRRGLERTPVVALVYELARQGSIRVEDEWTDGVGGRWRQGLRVTTGVPWESALERTRRGPAQRRVLELLHDEPDGLIVDELMRRAECGRAPIRALQQKALVESFRARAAAPPPAWTAAGGGAGTFELSPAQRASLARVGAALERRDPTPLLLHGVTGSGKTEVYLRAARQVLETGRRAILLVPEIGLTPLLEHRARAVLGDRVAVMHSAMPAGERLQAWWAARCNHVGVVIGPRSAVFAPLEDVGLIVLDEEQDGAYKQEERPRYHGRDVALQRAELEGAAVILGSATPAVETFYRARRGVYEVLPMPERVTSRALPGVGVIDMREEFARNGRTLLSETIEHEIRQRLERREQALILLNRRGFAAALLCRACGHRIQCPDCAVSLTLHRSDNLLRCHYCDHRMRVPRSCPYCSGGPLHDLGYGTQRLHQLMGKRFPEARICRFDADETRTRGAHARILSAFGRGEIDLLVGTQMLAKGHDFPSVTLVGVVGADDSLGLPDFRAAERTFQLLTQMAGRAGRGDVAGKVILQAYDPDHYAIQAAMAHDYESFFAAEIEYRRRFGYPPFASMIACVCRGKALASAKEEADNLAAALRSETGDEVRVLGPASPPLARLRGLHRLQLLLSGGDPQEVRAALGRALSRCAAAGRAPRDLRIDVDPINLM